MALVTGVRLDIRLFAKLDGLADAAKASEKAAALRALIDGRLVPSATDTNADVLLGAAVTLGGYFTIEQWDEELGNWRGAAEKGEAVASQAAAGVADNSDPNMPEVLRRRKPA